MAVDAISLQIAQITRILVNMGWEVIITDIGETKVRVTIQKDKEKIQKGLY